MTDHTELAKLAGEIAELATEIADMARFLADPDSVDPGGKTTPTRTLYIKHDAATLATMATKLSDMAEVD